MIVVQAARDFQGTRPLALGEPVLASPAFVQHRLFVRSLKHLICRQAGGTAPTKP